MILPFGCFMMIVKDIECNRCHKAYKNTENKTMSIIVNHSYMSICPDCTKEVAAMMGFTPENINKELSLIKEAETENNRKLRIKEGSVCFNCHKKFGWDEPRVRESNASNVESWHIACYPKTSEIQRNKSEGVGGGEAQDEG